MRMTERMTRKAKRTAFIRSIGGTIQYNGKWAVVAADVYTAKIVPVLTAGQFDTPFDSAITLDGDTYPCRIVPLDNGTVRIIFKYADR